MEKIYNCKIKENLLFSNLFTSGKILFSLYKQLGSFFKKIHFTYQPQFFLLLLLHLSCAYSEPITHPLLRKGKVSNGESIRPAKFR